jgi:hypothetical protein
MRYYQLFEQIIADIPVGRLGTSVPIMSNPSPNDLRRILNQQYPAARFFLFRNGDLYLWDGGKLIHGDVFNALKLDRDDIIAGGTIEELKETKEKFLARKARAEKYGDTEIWIPDDMAYFDADYIVGFADFYPESKEQVFSHPAFLRMIRGVNVTTIGGKYRSPCEPGK